MSDLRTAAQQALEALQYGSTTLVEVEKNRWESRADLAINALRAALEQPEQEPVAWLELRTLSSGGYASPIKEWHVTQNPSTSNAPRKPLYTHPPRKQEPFGYIWPTGRHPEFRYTKQMRDGVAGMPLYTHPPRREWRGLTEEEKLHILDDTMEGGDLMDIARAIEQALRSKNG